LGEELWARLNSSTACPNGSFRSEAAGEMSWYVATFLKGFVAVVQ
jgi:hypothetical protein